MSCNLMNKKFQESTAPDKTSAVPFKSSITVDISNASSNTEVLKMCLNKLGWTACSSENAPCDIIWHSITTQEYNKFGIPISNYFSSKTPIKINKFPCMNQLLRKGPLTRALNVMRRIFKEEYRFYPKTWFLPEQYDQFNSFCQYMNDTCKKECPKKELQNETKEPKTFIVKPNEGSQGDGIILIKDCDDYSKKVNKTRHFIVQEYISNPYLIDGLKFDLRIYCVIASINPLEIYICEEGMARFATLNYKAPSQSNLDQIYMHLTNYSLNKNNQEKFVRPENSESGSMNEDGSKRTLSSIYNNLRMKGHDVNKLKSDIDDIIVKTVIALLPEIKVETAYEVNSIPYQQQPEFFQILGFDILLMEDLQPMLLEVNCNPSLRIDFEANNEEGKKIRLPSQIDIDIKFPLVLDTLRLIAPKTKIYSKINSKSCLRNIYPDEANHQFDSYYIIQQIADIFITFTIWNHNELADKLMTRSDFKSFVTKCNLVNERFNLENLENIYQNLSKKWLLYNRKKTSSTGLCYQGFADFFFIYSELVFTDKHLWLRLKALLSHCKQNLLKLAKENNV